MPRLPHLLLRGAERRSGLLHRPAEIDPAEAVAPWDASWPMQQKPAACAGRAEKACACACLRNDVWRHRRRICCRSLICRWEAFWREDVFARSERLAPALPQARLAHPARDKTQTAMALPLMPAERRRSCRVAQLRVTTTAWKLIEPLFTFSRFYFSRRPREQIEYNLAPEIGPHDGNVVLGQTPQ